MTIIELCLVALTVSLVVLIAHLVKTLNNANRTLDNIHGITASLHDKTKAVDEFLAHMKELDGLVKYAKMGFNAAKKFKNKEKIILKRENPKTEN